MIGQRDPRERDPQYLGWVAKLPCAACMVHGAVRWGVHVAHLRAGSPEHDKRSVGKAEKPSDRWTLPLCPPHHTGDVRRVAFSQHSMNEEEFWAQLGIDPFQLCIDLRAAYEAGRNGVPIISQAAARGLRTIEGAPMEDAEEKTRRYYTELQRGGHLPAVALSIQQPWAFLMVNGWKPIENRTWKREAPPRVLVHAGKKMNADCLTELYAGRHPVSGEDLSQEIWDAMKARPFEEQLGGFVGVLDFTGEVLTESADPWFMGPYGYVAANAKPLPFLPWRGQLGFFPAKVAS